MNLYEMARKLDVPLEEVYRIALKMEGAGVLRRI
ncbi:MAG TPA: hypothetical protein VIV61_07785 [Candidatus Ozemobacteraceae bacterium]